VLQNALTIPGASADTLTMSSLEIAKLVEQRHDNVKRTIESGGVDGADCLPESKQCPE